MSYVVWNTSTSEALLIDPKREDFASYEAFFSETPSLRILAIIDTHTHADHISAGEEARARFRAPWVMSSLAPSTRPDTRIASTTSWPLLAAPLHFLTTPGHTADSLTLLWGPFLFGGDTLLIGDTGRDDLPGGDATAHWESLELIRKWANNESIVLPGHDHKGGRARKWSDEKTLNPSLTAERELFIKEASAFSGKAPRLLKESLRENLR